MAIVHLQSGLFEQASENEPSSSTPTSLTRRALLVYEGEFESMDGVVNVGRDELTTLATNHNGHIESASRLAEGKESMKDFPPVQLDHSTSAKDTVGRLIGKLELGGYKTKDGREVMAAYGNVKILGEENVVKVMDGRWTHLSVGVDFEKGKFSELTITPFPAAPEASLLKKNTETKLGAWEVVEGDYSRHWEKRSGGFILLVSQDDDDEKSYDYAVLNNNKEVDSGSTNSLASAKSRAEASAKKAGAKLSAGDTWMSTTHFGKYKYTISYKGDKIMKVIDAADEEEAEQKILDYAAEAFDLKSYSDINQVKITKMSIKKLNSWKQVHQNQADSYYEKRIGEYVLRAGFSDEEGQYFWNIAKKNNPQDEIDGGVVSTLTEAMRQAGAAASKLGVKLSEGDKSMDKDKMKKHMMEVQEMSEKDAEEKLAKCTEEEMKKLAAEVEEHEKKMAQEKPEEKKEMSEEKPEDKKEMSEAKEDEKKEMSKEEEKKDLAKEEDEDKEEMESSKEDKKLSAARERIVRLSSDFRKAFEGAQLAAKKGKIVSRLSALKSNAKITPAEIKKIDIERLASQGDETVDLVLKTYEDREPVVMTGALGSIKAGDLANLSKEIRMSRLEQETRQNMSLLKKTVKTRMQEEKEGGEVSIHVDTTPHVDQEIEMAYGEVCKMMDEGKLKEAKEMLKKYMVKTQGEGKMDMVEHDKQLSALAEESIKMQNKFDELQKLAVSLVG